MKFNALILLFKNVIRSFLFATIILSFESCVGQDNTKQRSKQSEKKESNFQHSTTSSLKLIAELNVKVKETSGLALINQFLLTHNDKGRSNQLFLLHYESGEIVHSLEVTNNENHDWEDLAESDENIFIGDMGNNEGERINLAIYIVPKKQINLENTQVKSSGSINFTYPDQKEFDISKKHNFDCEAILYFNHQLYLFTKNRLDDKTNLYVLPETPGNYVAKFLGSFEVGGRITGADISPDGKRIALIGYNKKSDCFLWTFDGFSGDHFFDGKSKYFNLGAYAQAGQIEGIVFKNNKELYISSEEIANVRARLYLLAIE